LVDRNASETDRLLFVLGGPKTASTSMVGLLNSHPDVLVMCEVYLNQSIVSRYGRRLVQQFPGLRRFFIARYGADWRANYREAHAWLQAHGFAKAYFGDKFARIDSGYSREIGDSRAIYCIRDVAEWVAKDSVREIYPLDADIVPFAAQFLKHFVESFLLPRVYYVKMPEFLSSNLLVTKRVFSFLELEMPAQSEQWWNTIGSYGEADPKSSMNWWKGHASSAIAPQKNDTSVRLRLHPFWDTIIPIFEKYYVAANERRMASTEVEADLHRLDEIIDKYSLSFSDAYEDAQSESQNDHFKERRRWRQRLGVFGRVLGGS
jgi:hypothetical protein